MPHFALNEPLRTRIQAVGDLIALNVSVVRNVRRKVRGILSRSDFGRCRLGCERRLGIPVRLAVLQLQGFLNLHLRQMEVNFITDPNSNCVIGYFFTVTIKKETNP